MKEEKAGWTKPVLFPYSTEYHDVDMGFSQDGEQLFFCSTRPVPGNTEPNSG